MNPSHSRSAPDWQRFQWTALAIGGGGFILGAGGAIFDPQQFSRSYLAAFTSWTGIALGSLALWMIHNLTGGCWGLVLRRFLEAATRTLPLLVLAFLPVAFTLPNIYSWAASGDLGEFHEDHPRVIYLNAPFFLARTGFYFALWLLLAYFLNRWAGAQARTRETWPVQRMAALSGPGLVIYGLTMTFAAVDWLMSLDRDWFSTIFGALVATGQMLPALGLAIALAAWCAERSVRAEATTPDIWNDLGNLLLAFVMLWAYMMFSQFLLIWSGNLPEEISWYLIRSEGGWQWIGVFLAVFYFALPFLLLLSRDLKRDPRRLRIVALAVVGLSFVQQFWMIAPVFSPRQFRLHWLDLATLAGLGGFWFAYFFWQLQSRPLVPIHDLAQPEAVSHA